MRISKKKLREILVEDLLENGLEQIKKRFSTYWIPPISESIRKGRRKRSIPIHIGLEINRNACKHFESKGFRTERVQYCRTFEAVSVKIFSEGSMHTCVLMTNDTAMKIIVLGMVPNLNE